MRLLLRASALACLLGAAAIASGQNRPLADHIYVNGKVWTADEAKPLAQAFATQGERIVGVGTNEEMRALGGASTAVVDLHGHLVTPGFDDAHWHFSSLRELELDTAASLQELQQRLANFAATHPEEPWILGHGWGYDIFPNRVPDRKYLDQVVPDRPVVLWERDGHMVLANTKAMTLAGLTRNTKDPADGRIEHRTDGEPTGEVKEGAMELLKRRRFRARDPAPLRAHRAVRRCQKDADWRKHGADRHAGPASHLRHRPVPPQRLRRPTTGRLHRRREEIESSDASHFLTLAVGQIRKNVVSWQQILDRREQR